MARQIGFYNATHRHGEPLENMIQKLKARRQGGAAGFAGGATRSQSLIDRGQSVNRANAPKGEMPPWVARQIAQQGGLPAVPPGIPAGVNPTKPQNPQRYPMIPQGGDAVQYPVRRPKRLPAWVLAGLTSGK